MSVDAKFWAAVQEAYDDPEAWSEERPGVQAILPAILGEAARYVLQEPYYVRRGGAGLVVRLHDSNLGTSVALKMARPVKGRETVLSEVIAGEIARLRETSHPNIVSIFWQGSVEHQKQQWPYYVMEYVEGAVDAWDYVRSEHPTAQGIVRLIHQIVQGIAHLHEHGTIHGDVKLENVLVAPGGQAKVSDLGSARLLGGEATHTVLMITPQWAHPDLTIRSYRTLHAEPDRLRCEIARSHLRREFDIYALGKNLRRVLTLYDPGEGRLLSARVRAYLELAADRMLDGLNRDDECALGLPRSCFADIKYSSIHQIAEDLRKITGEYAIHDAIPELDHHFPTTIQVSVAGSPAFTKRVANILQAEPVGRLANVAQLGIIARVYPTARHSRLEHVLGTFANVCRYIDSLWNDPINPLFRQIVSEDDIKAVLVAALCHDVGYYPSAHDFEEAEPDVFAHKPLADEMLRGRIPDAHQLVETIERDWGIKAARVAGILSANPADPAAPLVDRILHTLIDGPIDADKIDYLVRDSVNLRVPYGLGIDVERLLRCLTVAFRPEGKSTFATVGIHEKGKVPAESVAFARYALFGAVYWHHAVRAMKAMLHRAIWEAIPAREGIIDKRSRRYGHFHRQFISTALPELAVPAQLSLWDASSSPSLNSADLDQTAGTTTVTARHPDLSAADLPSGDLRMIRWLHTCTTLQGKPLLQMLCSRNLFKRLLVVSSHRADQLWPALVRFAERASAPEKIDFQRKVQTQLIDLILDLGKRPSERNGRTISALKPEAIDFCEAMATRGDILFLVDIPTSRPASQVDLCYVPEHRLGQPFVATSERVGLSYSTVWGSLAESFLESVGKVRVFVHPDIVNTAEAGLSRESIEGVLSAVVRQLAKR